MQKRFLLVLFLALLFKPAAAASTTMDPECAICDLPAWLCLCTTWAQTAYVPAIQLPEAHYLPHPTSHVEPTLHVVLGHTRALETPALEIRGPLLSEAIWELNADQTAVQRGTVQAHIEDTYTPGYPTTRRKPLRTRSPRRQAPQPGAFGCNIEGCTKRFNRACDLNRHLKIHLDNSERPHPCMFCGEGFLYPKDLSRHQRKHSEEVATQPNFYCREPGCHNTKGFSRRDNLLRHRRSKHRLTPMAQPSRF